MADEMIMDSNPRSMREITDLADLAGVSMGKGLVQSLSYSVDWMKDDFKLLELNKDLSASLHEGDEVIIRGEHDDDTVLCSKNKTFDLRAADTSNTLLLVPELKTPDDSDFAAETCMAEKSVLSCFSTYYEARLIKPKLDRLKNILETDAYSGHDNDSDVKKYNTEDILSYVQSSEEELMAALKYLGALQIHGNWRILDVNYQDKAFAQILALIEEKSWDWHQVPLDETCQVLEELYPDFVLEYCLQLYGTIKIDETDLDMECNKVFCLDEEKVCQYYAEYILRPAMGKFNYREFMEAWEQSVPDGMKIKEEYLRGVALTDLKTHPPVIWHFPEKGLPGDPAERLEVLFRTRQKWREEDIVPYLKNVVAPGQKISSLFLKYARCSTEPNGSKVYNSKHPIS